MAFRGNNQKNRHEKTEYSHKDLKSYKNTPYGAGKRT